MNSINQFFISVCIVSITIKSVYSINCYQCSGTDSNNPFQCTEFLQNDIDLVPIDCGTIHGAQYCIKHVGRFEGLAIECYQCNSSATMECGDGLMNLDGGILKPTSCEHVYNAQYCIKITAHGTGFYFHGVQTTNQGGISTKRYCSSLDLGNYCNYVQQSGDKLEYRTCIYTCDTDGCNPATRLKASIISLVLVITKYFI